MSGTLRVMRYRMKTLITSNHHRVYPFRLLKHFENSDCASGIEDPAMAFFTAADTRALKTVEQPCTNNSVFMQHCPNLSFYNKLPPNCPRHSNYLTIYDSTDQYYKASMNMQSRQSAMQDLEIYRFQDTEYDAMGIVRKSDRREENTNFASDLNCTSI
ncbi:hypothetical protein CEXT_5291 [Caerostris extrusa]|uniref:Uncharacterized protein n=1 Tax=Caerostris extrusa TaxID=172846 RepID=A0AAV4XVN5_CAEEX|nr:hypothetical protein CEXT_5291 [Caerostris extrusa]